MHGWLVHHRVLPTELNLPVPIYKPGCSERHCALSRNTIKSLWPGLKPRLLSVQTMQPLCASKLDTILCWNLIFCVLLGGGLLVAEMFLKEDKTGPRSTLLQSLNMLVQTHGKERTMTEYKELLEQQGFVDIQAKQPDFSSGYVAILCRKAWSNFDCLMAWYDNLTDYAIESNRNRRNLW